MAGHCHCLSISLSLYPDTLTHRNTDSQSLTQCHTFCVEYHYHFSVLFVPCTPMTTVTNDNCRNDRSHYKNNSVKWSVSCGKLIIAIRVNWGSSHICCAWRCSDLCRWIIFVSVLTNTQCFSIILNVTLFLLHSILLSSSISLHTSLTPTLTATLTLFYIYLSLTPSTSLTLTSYLTLTYSLTLSLNLILTLNLSHCQLRLSLVHSLPLSLSFSLCLLVWLIDTLTLIQTGSNSYCYCYSISLSLSIIVNRIRICTDGVV